MTKNIELRVKELSDHATVGDVICLRDVMKGDRVPRNAALYLVEDARSQGGGMMTSMSSGGADYYPDGWHIVARRLTPRRMYNPDGRTVSFYQTGQFSVRTIPYVGIVGKMQQHWYWSDRTQRRKK